MKAIMRNRHLVATEQVRVSGGKGVFEQVLKPKPEVGIRVYRRVSYEGITAYIPANKQAIKSFKGLTNDERKKIVTAEPPEQPEPLSAESKAVVFGFRPTKALPKGIRESEVFSPDGTVGVLRKALTDRLRTVDPCYSRKIKREKRPSRWEVVKALAEQFKMNLEDANVLYDVLNAKVPSM